MNFAEYEKIHEELTERRTAQISGLMQDCLALIRNGFESDPRIGDLLDDLLSIEIDYQIQITQLNQEMDKWMEGK